MKMSKLVNALAYELGLWLISRWPGLAFNPWVQRMLKHCRQDWSSWRAMHVMKSVSDQSEKILKKWAENNRKARCNKLAKKARDKFPNATITPVEDAVIPMVIIEEQNEASPLGGSMRITWRIED